MKRVARCRGWRISTTVGSRASQPKNRYVGITYIADNARMAVPPAFFLQRLHDYDSDLVIVPSRYKPYAYVIARRRRFSKWASDKAIEGTIDQPDTLMCMRYGLVPVCLMFQHGAIWNPDTILARLKARDLWANGGPDRVADQLEAAEEEERQKIRSEIRDDIWNRSGAAWRSYQRRTGASVSLNPSTTRTGRRQKQPLSSSSTAGSGALWTPERPESPSRLSAGEAQ